MIYAGVVAASLMIGIPIAAGAASLQDEFNAAQTAAEQRDFAKAAVGYEKVIAQLQQAGGQDRTLAQIRARLGAARLALGEFREAAEAFELALPDLTGEADWTDRLDTQLELGKAREALLDYDEARKIYAALLSDLERREGPQGEQAVQVYRKTMVSARVAMARVSLFEEPEAARRQLDFALPEAEALFGQTGDQLGEIYTLRGRTELMTGNLNQAYVWLEKALAAAGGLNFKITPSDMRIRGDLGLVAQLMGREAEARKYLAYTGLGTAGINKPLNAVHMPLPACGDATGLRPEDAAVVEFGMGADGQVVYAQPIYATRTGSVALEFARAVTEWSWSPDDVEALPLFWRSNMRVELRCTKEVQRINLFSTFASESDAWLTSRQISLESVQAVEGESAPHQARILRKLLADREAEVGRNDLSLLPVMLALSQNPTIPAKYRQDLTRRAEGIAAEHAPPLGMRIMLRFLNVRNQVGMYGSRWLRFAENQYSGILADLKQRSEAQTRAGAWIMVELANIYERLRDQKKAEQFYQEALGVPETAISAGDPIRQLAVVRLASLKAAEKRFDEANGLLQAAGLRPEQCELVDIKPIGLNVRMTTDDYPKEALRWGFKGWVQVDYDINVEGRVVEPRTVIAHPPFIFGPPTEKVVSRFRYKPMYRAGESIGCTGYSFKVWYGTY